MFCECRGEDEAPLCDGCGYCGECCNCTKADCDCDKCKARRQGERQ